MVLGTLTVDGEPGEVARARHYVRDLLIRTGHRSTARDAELLTSECVTNALRFTLSGAAGGRVTVTVLSHGDAVRVEVLDQGGADSAPAPRGVSESSTAEDGRGLQIVQALAKEWGAEPSGPGTLTWFTVAARQAPSVTPTSCTAGDGPA